MSGRTYLPEYRVWMNMIQRCTNPKNPSYPDYGGRGIKICERWRMSFEDFYSDMGPRTTPDHSIERDDVDGHYEPGNCRWATWPEQFRNKRNSLLVVVDGEKRTITEAARDKGINAVTARDRLITGRSIEEIFSPDPVIRRRNSEQYVLDGQSRSLKAWGEDVGLSYAVMYNRVVVKGMDLKSALAIPLKLQKSTKRK